MYYEQAFKSNYIVRLVDNTELSLTEIYYGGPRGYTPMLHGFNTVNGEERRVPLAMVMDRTIRMALSLELLNGEGGTLTNEGSRTGEGSSGEQ